MLCSDGAIALRALALHDNAAQLTRRSLTDQPALAYLHAVCQPRGATRV
jgi:hypothetical protein